jgi:hypothetical protein
MRVSFCVPLLALGLALSSVARAERVVILEVDGDTDNRLREQVERAVKQSKQLDVVDYAHYAKTNARRPLKGSTKAEAKGHDGAFDLAVRGTLTDTFFVQIVDASNQEIWSKDLPVREGLLSTDNARRLAKAIVAAAQSVVTDAQVTPPQEAEKAPAVSVEADAPVIKGPGQRPHSKPTLVADASSPSMEMPGLDLTAPEPTLSHSDGASSSTDADLEAEIRHKPRRVGPKLIEVQATGTTTWRSYCSRPGVTSCGAYDNLAPSARPPGTTVDFSPAVPYPGVGVTALAFPLQGMSGLIRGAGVEGSFSRGFSVTNVGASSTTGDASQSVQSTDDSYEAMALFHYFFDLGGDRQQPLMAHIGVRAGLEGRTFEVDPTAKVPLPGTHRRFPAVGLDGSFAFFRFLRADATVLYFISPTAGADELVGYGTSVTSTGWGLQAGLSGDIWGPVGYVVRLNYQSFQDQFIGKGNVWSTGGAAEESYAGLYWGVTATF